MGSQYGQISLGPGIHIEERVQAEKVIGIARGIQVHSAELETDIIERHIQLSGRVRLRIYVRTDISVRNSRISHI